MFWLLFIGFCSIPALIALFITLATSGTADDMMVYFLIATVVLMLVGLTITEGNKVKNKSQRDRMIKEQEEQEKYDNDWGIIDHKHK